MNRFTINKLAEVQAFVALGYAIRSRAGETFEQIAQPLAMDLGSIRVDLAAGLTAEQAHAFTAKQEKTITKLVAMMELYIGDDWDDPVEVLEWLSFYCGAASAHAALAASAVDALGHHALRDQVGQLSTKFHNMSAAVTELLSDIGSQLARTA